MEDTASSRLRAVYPVLGLAGLAIYGWVLYRTAWLSDDAYITLRTVDNFVHGYGLRWNVAERVQSYTHPLWMFLLSAVYMVTREEFVTTIFFSIFCATAAVAVMLFGEAKNRPLALACVAALIFSRAFVDYSTSGLENPLTHLLLACFVWVYFRERHTPGSLLLLSLIAFLAAFNRMDTILFYLPALAYAWFRVRSLHGLAVILAGAFPFVLWEVFCVIYYGFPFPNTAYAKLGTGIPSGELWMQGVYYFVHTLQRDPMTLAMVGAAIVVPLVLRWKESIPLILGLVLYLVYILKVGGDFMGGRFFTGPLFLAVLLLARLPVPERPKAGVIVAAAAVFLSILRPNAPPFTGPDFGTDRSGFKDAHGIGDERCFWFQNTCLWRRLQGEIMPQHAYADTGRGYRSVGRPVTKVHGSVGFRGFFAGPVAHIIDYYALADPLLARLPAKYAPAWRIGHFMREIPKGYVESRPSGPNHLADASLGQYLDHLDVITQGPIWTAERWRTIWHMNLGHYNGLIEKDRYRWPGLRHISSSEIPEDTKPDGKPTVVPDAGLEVDFGERWHENEITLGLDRKTQYRVVWMDGEDEIFKADVIPPSKGTNAVVEHTVGVDEGAAKQGYTSIRLKPYRGKQRHVLAYLRAGPRKQ